MANTIVLKKSSVASKIPTTSDLAYGEVALNYTDGKLYYKTSDNLIKSFNASVTSDDFLILDSISSSFNGVLTQFTIASGSTNFINSEISSAARLLISVGGVIQQPDPGQGGGFYITGGTNRTTDPIKINFVEAPRAGQSFFGVAIKTTNSTSTPFATSEAALAYSITFGI